MVGVRMAKDDEMHRAWGIFEILKMSTRCHLRYYVFNLSM